ncbi:DUF5709 domain-containing protein [Pengzhenrongella sicca]|uniref:DUF5709 domain-containing protein n=1 Tax=Pengzhenrongella sicca TaxID=2819238 RepID=A0A8A4ZAZ5_9MICO|nr:DUF5709 domain-containing protein [Pengzhenrongella sicca]QTE29054.1 hypothetical protein J4E96_17390 [Pengzhenrongella sicca]
MSNDTPGTSPDPETGAEGDSDQLSAEDTLLDRGVDDLLDEGYSPPDRPRTNRFGETAWEEAHGESLEQRLNEEEPESWDAPERGARQPDRAGRLVADDDALDGHRPNDSFAADVGLAGGAASAEEAAMRIIREPRS